jgi:hypothetical protein
MEVVMRRMGEMARSVRIQYEGAIYHVMCRGDRREAIFEDDEDREMFVATMGEMCGRAEKWRCLRRGWFLGGDEFREKLMKMASGVVSKRKRGSYRREGLRRHDEREAEELLSKGMERLGVKEMAGARGKTMRGNRRWRGW